MKNKTKIFLIFINLAVAASAFGQKNLPGAYSAEISKAFAFDLYQTGFYSEAETELKRYFFTTTAPIDETAVLTLNSIYNSQDNLSGCQWIFQNLFSKVSLPSQEKLNLVYGRLIFKTQDAEKFAAFRTDISSSFEQYSLDFKNLIQISDLILSKNIEDAKVLTQNAAELNQDFAVLSECIGNYKLKSAGLSLFLSMICPGAGKWYCGSFSQGASSFISIASFVTATVYTGIQSEWKSWQPYVYGSCGLILYIVDCYGAYQAAKRYNQAAYRTLCTTTEDVYEALY